MAEEAPATTRGRRVAYWSLTVVLALAAVELGSCAIHLASTGEWLSPGRLSEERSALSDADVGRLPGENPLADERIGDSVLHPYLGYVDDPDRIPSLSREGFYAGGEELPTEADPSIVVVGLFGGSLAMHLAMDDQELLTRTLGSVPAFEGRTVRLVIVSIGGWRQPQQMLALSYLLARGYHFDVVINLDGFNEVLGGTKNYVEGFSPYYPYAHRSRAATVQGPEYLMLAGSIRGMHDTRNRLAGAIEAGPWRHSLTVSFVWSALDRPLAAAIAERRTELRTFAADPENAYAQLGAVPRLGDPDEAAPALFERLHRVWLESSVQMAATARLYDVQYLHFLQPNQHVADSKTLTEQERQEAFDEDLPPHVGRAYRLLRGSAEELERRGVAFHDLTRIYADVDETIYRDRCCHVNARGNAMLAQRIAEAIAGEPGAMVE